MDLHGFPLTLPAICATFPVMKTIWLCVRPTLSWFAVAAILVIPVLTLPGAVDMFLKIDDVKGESMDDKHQDEINVLAWSWGLKNSGTTHVKGGEGKSSVQDLNITKYIDKSTPALMLATLTGRPFDYGILTVRKAGGKEAIEYIKIEMKEILVTGISTGGSGGEDRLTENVTLNFASFKLTYTPQKPDGSADAAVPVAWSIIGNEPRF